MKDLVKKRCYIEEMSNEIPPMVNVVWLDTNECSMSTWQSKEELLDSKFCTVDSLGYLIADKEDCVIIAGDKDTYNKDDIYGRAQVIPKGVVLDIQFLSKNEDNN